MSEASLAHLREHDRAAYLGVLAAPASLRPSFAAVAAYVAEMELVPLRVSEPAAGEIRLRWWEEVVLGERDGEAASSPLAAPLVTAIRDHGLPREALAQVAEAHTFDLYSDPMPDMEALEEYAGRTRSVPIQVACSMLEPAAAPAAATAAGHAGVFSCIVDRLRTLSRDRIAGRCFVPEDVLLSHWSSAEAVLRLSFGQDDATKDAASTILNEMVEVVEKHYAAFREAVRLLPKILAPAFAAANARTATLAAVKRHGVETWISMPPPRPVREQVAVALTGRAFGRVG